MNRKLRKLSFYATMGMMAGLAAAGVVNAGTVGPIPIRPTDGGSVVATVSTSPTVVEVTQQNKNLDITSGTIETSNHMFGKDKFTNGQWNVQGNNASLEQFTALSDIVPADLLSQILSDPAFQSDVAPFAPDIATQLTTMMNNAGDPTVPEYIAANGLGTELAYNVPTTQVLGSETVQETGSLYKGIVNVTQPQLGVVSYGSDSIVSDPSGSKKTMNVGDIQSIIANTIGARQALTSQSNVQLGQPFEFEYVETTQTIQTVTINGFSQQVTVQNNVDTLIDVDFYEVTGNRFVSPIVLDVAGQGKLEASNGLWLPHATHFDGAKVRIFDFFNNGFPMAMEWVGKHDGLLVEPKEDGMVDASCLFGTQGGWDNGYEKLSLRDTNHDGKLTGEELKGLSIWIDANQDARCQPEELKSVQDMGITEINLNHHNYKSTFVMNGQTRSMWDWFPTGVEIKHISRDAALQNLQDFQAATKQN